MRQLRVAAVAIALCASAFSQGPRSTADAMRGNFSAVNQHLLEMAKDFPADKYDFKLKPEMRSFGEVLVHVASGNVYAAKIGSGQKANWD